MDTGLFFEVAVFTFIIIYCAVRFAIAPLIKPADSVIIHKNKSGLFNLMDSEIIS